MGDRSQPDFRLAAKGLTAPSHRFLIVQHRAHSPAQLKTMQEVITLIVFAGFSAAYLRAADLEPRHRICANCGGCILRLPRPSVLARVSQSG